MSKPTFKNDCSSRSCAIIKIRFSDGGELKLVDMAGSEWGSDKLTKHDKYENIESMLINWSKYMLK